MPERDGYIPGVPCWVDTSQPDPEAATDFYGGLYGWEFESVLPEDSEGKYFIASLSGGRVAAVGSIPEGAPEMAVWNTYIWVESADDAASKATRRRRVDRHGALRRHGRRPHGGHRRPRGRGDLRVGGEREQGRAGRERPGHPELQQPQHP